MFFHLNDIGNSTSAIPVFHGIGAPLNCSSSAALINGITGCNTGFSTTAALDTPTPSSSPTICKSSVFPIRSLMNSSLPATTTTTQTFAHERVYQTMQYAV